MDDICSGVQLSGEELQLFQKLLSPIPNAQIPVIRSELSGFRHKVREYLDKAQADGDQPFIDSFTSALGLCDIAEALLTDYPRYSREQKSWIIGAVLYLIQEEDVQSDFAGPTGFDDDYIVMKQVLLALQRHDPLPEKPRR